MTAPSVAAVPGTSQQGRRRYVPAPALPVRQLAGVGLAMLAAVAIEVSGRPPGIDPALLLPVVVVAATIVGGLVGGALAGSIGAVYAVLYYAQPAWHGFAGTSTRVAVAVLASALLAWLVGLLRDRIDIARATANHQVQQREDLLSFASRLANEPAESLPDALVIGAAQLLDADMCVLTVLDPPSGRHHVRSLHGTDPAALGVEVLAGVGVTGQALRERRMVVLGGHAQASGVTRLGPRHAGSGKGSSTQVVAAVPGLQAGRVITTLTVGRSANRRPFDADDLAVIEQVVPIVTLAVSGLLARREAEDGSPRDSTTGLYTRAYLDAALEQVLALRRRTAPADRAPLSIIMFDVDSFRLLNERHGRQIGDHVLRAFATLLRQRFRASDVMARVGPDSFLVVLNGANSEVAADAAAQVRRQVRELALSGSRGEPVILSVSAGCALFHDGDLPEVLVRSAEAALETARWSGPGAVVSI